jgi:hypothetical protein
MPVSVKLSTGNTFLHATSQGLAADAERRVGEESVLLSGLNLHAGGEPRLVGDHAGKIG